MNHTYEDVLAKFNSRNKNLQIDKFDIIDWCSELVYQVGNLDYCDFFRGYPLTIKDQKVAKPCNFYKLDLVLIDNQHMNSNNFRERNKYIDFDKNYVNCFMDYYGIPIDAEGYPEIANEDVAEACYWYCMEMLFMDDFLTNNIDATRYQYILDSKEKCMNEASASLRRYNKNRQTKMNMIMLNMKPTVQVPRYL